MQLHKLCILHLDFSFFSYENFVAVDNILRIVIKMAFILMIIDSYI